MTGPIDPNRRSPLSSAPASKVGMASDPQSSGSAGPLDDIVLSDTPRYGPPSEISKQGFYETRNLIPPRHRKTLADFGVRYFALGPGQDWIGSGILDIEIKPIISDELNDLARTIWDAIGTLSQSSLAPATGLGPAAASLAGKISNNQITTLRLLDATLPLPRVAKNIMGFENGTIFNDWFLRAVKHYNPYDFGLVPDEMMPQASLTANKLYLIPNVCLVDRNEFSNQAPSDERVAIPFDAYMHHCEWHASEGKWGGYDKFCKDVLLWEEQLDLQNPAYKYPGSRRCFTMVHETGHGLQHWLEQTRPEEESQLRRASALMADEMWAGRGLASMLPKNILESILKNPEEELTAYFYEGLRSGGLGLFTWACTNAPQFWNAYQAIERIGL